MDQQSFSRLDPSLSLAAYSLSHLQQQQQQPSAEGDTTLSPSHSKSNELPPNSNDLGRSSPEMHASDHVDVAAPPEPAPDPAPPLERNHESAVPESSYPAEVSPTDTPAVAHEPNVSETENAPQGQSTAPDEATGHGAPIDGQNKQDSIDYGNESHPSDENPPESELPPPTATGEDHQESVPDQASLKAPSGQRANQWDASQGVPETPDRKRGGTKLPALSRRIGDDLKEVYASASFIVNFAATHLNNLTSPRPDEVQIAISKALSITQNLTGLLSAPDQSKSGKDSVARSQYNYSAPSRSDGGPAGIWDAQLSSSNPSEMTPDARHLQDSSRKRQRSDDWRDDNGGYDYGTQASRERPGSQLSRSSSGVGLAMSPSTPAYSKVNEGAYGGSAHSFNSPGDFEGKNQTPQYKKRSRAPAPGSCQACGTNETPEWRRGPDGARTLCNACGLHFAKLVRKRNSQQEKMNGEPVPPVTIDELRAATKSHEGGSGGGSGLPAPAPAPLNVESGPGLSIHPNAVVDTLATLAPNGSSFGNGKIETSDATEDSKHIQVVAPEIEQITAAQHAAQQAAPESASNVESISAAGNGVAVSEEKMTEADPFTKQDMSQPESSSAAPAALDNNAMDESASAAPAPAEESTSTAPTEALPQPETSNAVVEETPRDTVEVRAQGEEETPDVSMG